jgi:hypothetical protein
MGCDKGSTGTPCPNYDYWGPTTPYYPMLSTPVSAPGATSPGIPLSQWITAIEWQAAANAEAYWDFLKSAGFNNEQTIPPDCLVPAPYVVLPSSINTTYLNATEWESLYLAALEGMGNFYNVSLSGTQFCGTQAGKQWSIGGAIWGNLVINATGYIYLNNGTSPVTLSGALDPAEVFGNRSTWAVGQTHYYDRWFNGSEQLLLMPTLATASIPVGTNYEIPKDDPIEVYVVQVGAMITATGNGSSPSAPQVVPLGTLSPGDAIYLTSCTVNGVSTSNCTVTVQTVNVTITKYSCNGPCNQSAPSGGGGTFGGLPNPFSWLAGLFSSLFGGGPLGQLVGSIVAAVVVLAVILVLVYAVYRLATSKRSKSAGGQTVVVEGGRR